MCICIGLTRSIYLSILLVIYVSMYLCVYLSINRSIYEYTHLGANQVEAEKRGAIAPP